MGSTVREEEVMSRFGKELQLPALQMGSGKLCERGAVGTTRWDFYRQNYNAPKPRFPQFDRWCQFSSVIVCDPQWEVAGTKWVCSSALVRPFPVDFTHSSLIDNAFYPEDKQTSKTSETPSYNAWIYLRWTAKKLQMFTFIKSAMFSTGLEHLYNAA